jgi:hypothetical protein
MQHTRTGNVHADAQQACRNQHGGSQIRRTAQGALSATAKLRTIAPGITGRDWHLAPQFHVDSS